MAPFTPGGPWPSQTYKGGAICRGWSGYVRLLVQAQIDPGTPFTLGASTSDRLNDGNVLADASTSTRQQLSGLWVDLTCDLTDLKITLGASSTDAGVLSKPEAATLTATLFDPTGKYDPANPDSVYALGGRTRLRPGVPVRAFVETTDEGATAGQIRRFPLFTGTADRWSEDWKKYPVERFAKLVASDPTKVFNKYNGLEQPPVGDNEQVRDRISRICTYFASPVIVVQQYPAGPSPVRLQSTTLAQSALEMVNRAVDDELGFWWFAPTLPDVLYNPQISYWPRGVWQYSEAPFIRLGCADAFPGVESYDIVTDVSVLSFDQLLHNTVYASRTGGTMQTVVSQASVDLYGTQSIQRSDLGLKDDAQAAAWGNALVSMQAFPQTTIDSIELQPAAAGSYKQNRLYYAGPAWDAVLGYHPVHGNAHLVWSGAGYTVDTELRVIGVEHDITRDDWVVTWRTVPTGVVPAGSVFHVGPHAQDRLDAGFLLGG